MVDERRMRNAEYWSDEEDEDEEDEDDERDWMMRMMRGMMRIGVKRRRSMRRMREEGWGG